jgi:DNA-binding transcriptional LysR family regulator
MTQFAQIAAFLEAAHTGSLIRAAERLHISHSAMSARIRALEDDMQARLFHRGRHGVRLTEAGEALVPLAETALRAWRQGRTTVQSVSAGARPIRAGMQQDLWEFFAPAAYAQLRAADPPVQLRLMSDYSDTLCARIEEGLMDLALVFEPSHERGVALERIASLPLRMVSDRPGTWTGALPEDYVYVNWGARFNAWHRREVGDFAVSPLVVGVSGIARSTLRRFGGAAFLPLPGIASLLECGALHPLSGAPECSVDVFVATAQGESGARLEPLLDAIRVAASAIEAGTGERAPGVAS